MKQSTISPRKQAPGWYPTQNIVKDASTIIMDSCAKRMNGSKNIADKIKAENKKLILDK